MITRKIIAAINGEKLNLFKGQSKSGFKIWIQKPKFQEKMKMDF